MNAQPEYTPEELDLAAILFDAAQADLRPSEESRTKFYRFADATPDNRAGCLAIARHVLTYYAPRAVKADPLDGGHDYTSRQ